MANVHQKSFKAAFGRRIVK